MNVLYKQDRGQVRKINNTTNISGCQEEGNYLPCFFLLPSLFYLIQGGVITSTHISLFMHFLTAIIICSPIYLVKSREDVVGKLDLSNGSGTSHSYTDTESHNALLTKGSVEDSVLT